MAPTTASFSIVQASGIEASTSALHHGEAASFVNFLTSATTGNLPTDANLTQFGGFNESNVILQFGGIAEIGFVLSFEGVGGVGENILQVPSGFVGQTFVVGAIGSSGSIERFFDRSPFFFEPPETDPNDLRDLREFEQFMVFSSAVITSFDNFFHTTATGTVVAFPADLSSPASVYSGPPTLEFFRGADGQIITATFTGTSSVLEAPLTLSGSDDVIITDELPPYFDETVPATGTLFNDPATDITLHVKDDHSPLDNGAGSLEDIFIDGVQVVNNGAVATGTLWPTITRTLITDRDIQYDFERSEDFPLQSVVNVSGILSDFATPGNIIFREYFFQIRGEATLSGTISGSLDADPPIITPIEPTDGATGVSASSHVIFNIFDVARGVDPSLTKLFLNGGLVIDGTTIISGTLARTGNPDDGFTYDYTPGNEFVFGSTVTGTIEATDLAATPNTDSLIYEFTITPTDSLQISNFFLSEGESALLNSGTLISVDITDTVFGVNSGTTTISVNGDVPSGATPIPITSGIRFEIPADPLIDFREDLTVFVHAENNFPGTFPQIEEETFVLRPGYDVIWPNKSTVGPEETFPYLDRVLVLLDIKNFAKNFAQQTEFFPLRIENQAKKDLSATIESNIKVADLPATLTSINPHFEYGKTIVLEIEADDLEGNQLRFTHTFTIEPKP